VRGLGSAACCCRAMASRRQQTEAQCAQLAEEIADGVEQMAVSAELRDFVDHGTSSACTVEHLLARPWLSGAKLPGSGS
jgi:5-carboxymethyl-2-hydroxymuconate isomerase